MDLSVSVFVHVWVCVLSVCMCVYMYIADCVCFTTWKCEIGFTETDCHQLILCNIPLPVHLIKKKKILKRCWEWDLTGTTLSPVGGSEVFSHLLLYKNRLQGEKHWWECETLTTEKRTWGESLQVERGVLFVFVCLMSLSHFAECDIDGCDISWDFCSTLKLSPWKQKQELKRP